jgi:capsular polysaccharide export protein
LTDTTTTAGGLPRRLCVYTGGFLRDRRIRRIMDLAGHRLAPGWPGQGDGVAVWGRSPHAWRGEAVARRTGVPLIRVEDAFLRSIHPGRTGAPTLGLMLDGQGVHFDAASPSRMEMLLTSANLSDPALLTRASAAIARIRHLHLSKYNNCDPDLPVPAPGYILLIDQTRGDASITHGGAGPATFAAMLAHVQTAHPGARIVIKTHPETAAALRPGHFAPAQGVELVTAPVSPWALLAGASQVHAVTSQLGWEAVLAGHRPVIWGQPWYAGWGLTDDRTPPARRGVARTVEQAFAAAMILAPTWYDPCRDRLCEVEEVIDQLEAEVRAYRQDHAGHVAAAMRLWKRRHLQATFGRERPLRFIDDPAEAAEVAADTGRGLLVWAGKEPPGLTAPRILRVEDGFLRSRGLGADLIPPLSLVADDLGIYYDPTRESRLERLIAAPLPPGGRDRAQHLLVALLVAGVTKYNLGGMQPDLPPGHRILVPGQVEDDASILRGAGDVRTNAALIRAARAANPGAVIVYKPHPDVEAGLRHGAVDPETLALADVVATRTDPAALIAACDQVWTMTSTLGWEALIRGKPVTTLGAPFYAGWGLTTDLGPVPARRAARPDILALVHAALIAYPRYIDPVNGLPCPPEVAVDRLANGPLPRPGPANRLLAKAQGALAGWAHLWR